MNSIILVDDNQEFIKSFTNEAFAKGITVAGVNSLEGLQQLLPRYSNKYAAVVLDIKCLLKDDQVKENAAFITAALKYLDTTCSGFPRFILTGDESEFDTLKRYYTDEKMYVKKPDDQEKLLNELLYCIQNAEPLRLRRENLAIFDAFDKSLLPSNKENTLLSILRQYNETDITKFRGIIGDIRELHEEIYKSINSRDKNVVPDIYMNGNGSPIFSTAFYKHLEGNLDRNNNYNPTTKPYQDSTVQSATKFVHATCSEYLHGTSRTNYTIGSYSVKALINALLELIIWSKQF